jgi:tetratricopeptide (TPR) repeat protein
MLPQIKPPPPYFVPERRPPGPLAVAAVVVAVLLAACGVGYYIWQANRRESLPPREPESAADKFAEAREAFSAPVTAGSEDEESAAIRAALDGLLASVLRDDRAATYALFDVRRMVTECLRIEGMPRMTSREQAQVAAGFETGLRQSDGFKIWRTLGWKRIDVRKIRFTAERTEALVYFRVRGDGDEPGGKLRWWMHKTSAGWKLFDGEDLEAGSRMSSLLAAVLAAAGRPGAGPPQWVKDLPHVNQALQKLAVGDLDGARAELSRVSSSALPPMFEALRQFAQGSLELQQGRLQEALACYERAERLNADMPVVDMCKAGTLNGLGRHAEALVCARRYEDLLGVELFNLEQITTALLALNRKDEAADAFRKGLAEFPHSASLVIGLGRTLPAGKRAELVDHVARLKPAVDGFNTVASAWIGDRDAELLEAAVAGVRKASAGVDASEPNVPYYAAIALGFRKEHAKAAEALASLLNRAKTPEDRKVYLDEYLSAAAEAYGPVKAYAAAPEGDRRVAFRTLLARVFPRTDAPAGVPPDPRPELIAAHAKNDAADPWLNFQIGQDHVLAGRLDKAEAAYAKAASAGPSKDDADSLRFARVSARYQAGRGPSALAELDPKPEVFSQLAALYAGDSDADGLEGLIAAYRATRVGDPNLPLWEAEVHWLRADYSGAVSVLTNRRREILAGELNRRRFEDRLIRSLVRLKDAARARQELALTKIKAEVSLLPAVVAAAEGRVAAVEESIVAYFDLAEVRDKPAELERRLEEIDDLYGDDDLGPLLRRRDWPRCGPSIPSRRGAAAGRRPSGPCAFPSRCPRIGLRRRTC